MYTQSCSHVHSFCERSGSESGKGFEANPQSFSLKRKKHVPEDNWTPRGNDTAAQKKMASFLTEIRQVVLPITHQQEDTTVKVKDP